MSLFLTLLLLFFIILSALTSAAHSAYFSLSPMQARSYAQEKDDKKKKVAFLLTHPRQLLMTIMFTDIFFNLMAQNTASTLFGESAGWVLKVGVPLILTLVIGEIIPKSIALPNNQRFAEVSAPTLFKLQKILTPLCRWLVSTATFISRLLFFFLKKEQPISSHELEHALERSVHQGVLEKEESDLLEGYLRFKEIEAKELMKPRSDILYYNLSDPLTQLVHLFVDEECSKVPVCQGELQNLIGILNAKDYFLNKEKIHQSSDLIPLLLAPRFVPEATSGRQILKLFAEFREHLLIVVDEYGSIAGLLTSEDLMEVVIGEIIDKREKTRYTQTSENVIIASGKLELLEFEEIFDIPLHSEYGMVTLGGWLTEKMGQIPPVGAQYKTHEFLFQVLAADPQRIRRIYVRKLENQELK